MGEKMRKAPIFLTLGQVRFNPILQMAESVSALQERLRKLGYADFSKDDVKTIQVNADGPTPQVDVIPTVRWRFANARKTSEYLLFADRLIFQTTAYETSDRFIESILSGVQLVHETVQLAYIEGVSVRTLDAIVPVPGETLTKYLHPQLLGFYGLSTGKLKQNFLQALSEFEGNKQLITKVVVLSGRLGIAIDLLPITLVVAERFTMTNCEHAILDNDCAIQERFEWDQGNVSEKLRSAKSTATEAFKSAVTREALDAWR
ncbi:MAG: TIGR04255 family protein [Terracidiphilus sp.]